MCLDLCEHPLLLAVSHRLNIPSFLSYELKSYREDFARCVDNRKRFAMHLKTGSFLVDEGYGLEVLEVIEGVEVHCF